MEEPDGTSRTVLLGVETWSSTWLPRASRQPACEACCGTVPVPSAANASSAPLVGTDLGKVIAQARRIVKNKVRT